MPTTIVHTVGAAPGRDYSSIQGAINDVRGDFITNDEIHVLELYDDAPFFVGSSGVNLVGAACDATRFWIIRPAPGHEYDPATGTGVRISGTGAYVLWLQDFASRTEPGIYVRNFSSSNATPRDAVWISNASKAVGMYGVVDTVQVAGSAVFRTRDTSSEAWMCYAVGSALPGLGAEFGFYFAFNGNKAYNCAAMRIRRTGACGFFVGGPTASPSIGVNAINCFAADVAGDDFSIGLNNDSGFVGYNVSEDGTAATVETSQAPGSSTANSTGTVLDELDGRLVHDGDLTSGAFGTITSAILGGAGYTEDYWGRPWAGDSTDPIGPGSAVAEEIDSVTLAAQAATLDVAATRGSVVTVTAQAQPASLSVDATQGNAPRTLTATMQAQPAGLSVSASRGLPLAATLAASVAVLAVSADRARSMRANLNAFVARMGSHLELGHPVTATLGAGPATLSVSATRTAPVSATLAAQAASLDVDLGLVTVDATVDATLQAQPATLDVDLTFGDPIIVTGDAPAEPATTDGLIVGDGALLDLDATLVAGPASLSATLLEPGLEHTLDATLVAGTASLEVFIVPADLPEIGASGVAASDPCTTTGTIDTGEGNSTLTATLAAGPASLDAAMNVAGDGVMQAAPAVVSVGLGLSHPLTATLQAQPAQVRLQLASDAELFRDVAVVEEPWTGFEYPSIVETVIARAPEFADTRDWVVDLETGTGVDTFAVQRVPIAWGPDGEPTLYRCYFPIFVSGNGGEPLQVRESDSPGADGSGYNLTPIPRASLGAAVPAEVRFRFDLGTVEGVAAFDWENDAKAYEDPIATGPWVEEDWYHARINPQGHVLPPIGGVHVLMRRYATNAVILDVNIHNGATEPRRGFVTHGAIKFRGLQMRLSAGAIGSARIKADLYRHNMAQASDGRSVELVNDAGVNVIPPLRQFRRRFAIYDAGTELANDVVLEDRAYARAISGPCAPVNAECMPPTMHRIPDFDREPLRSETNYDGAQGWDALELWWSQRLSNLQNSLQAGSSSEFRFPDYPLLALGPFHPVWAKDRGGNQGGVTLNWPHMETTTQTRSAVRYLRLWASMQVEHARHAFYDIATGLPITPHDQARYRRDSQGGTYELPDEISMSGDGASGHQYEWLTGWWGGSSGFGGLHKPDYDPGGLGQGDYEAQLTGNGIGGGYQNEDTAHQSRENCGVNALFLATGDPLALLHFRNQVAHHEAGQCVMTVDENRENTFAVRDTYGGATVNNRPEFDTGRIDAATANPGVGSGRRSAAWCAYYKVFDYATSSPGSQRRADTLDWLDNGVLAWVDLAILPSGHMMNVTGGISFPNPFDNVNGADYPAGGVVPDGDGVAQSFEEDFWMGFARAVRRSRGLDGHPADQDIRSLLVRCAASYYATLPGYPANDSSNASPRKFLSTSSAGVPYPADTYSNTGELGKQWASSTFGQSPSFLGNSWPWAWRDRDLLPQGQAMLPADFRTKLYTPHGDLPSPFDSASDYGDGTRRQYVRGLIRSCLVTGPSGTGNSWRYGTVWIHAEGLNIAIDDENNVATATLQASPAQLDVELDLELSERTLTADLQASPAQLDVELDREGRGATWFASIVLRAANVRMGVATTLGRPIQVVAQAGPASLSLAATRGTSITGTFGAAPATLSVQLSSVAPSSVTLDSTLQAQTASLAVALTPGWQLSATLQAQPATMPNALAAQAETCEFGVEAYAAQLLDGLPSGEAWAAKQVPTSVLSRLMLGIAGEYAEVDCRVFQLLRQRSPLTATDVDMLSDWERFLGLPGDCGIPLDGELQRQQAANARLNSRRSQTPAAYVELAAKYGLTATITEYRLSRAGHARCGTVIRNEPWHVGWTIHIAEPNPGGGAFECAVDQARPAHTAVDIRYESSA